MLGLTLRLAGSFNWSVAWAGEMGQFCSWIAGAVSRRGGPLGKIEIFPKGVWERDYKEARDATMVTTAWLKQPFSYSPFKIGTH